MEENKDLWGTIEVPPHNSFYAKYKLYQTDNNEILSTIQPSFKVDDDKDFTIVIRRTEYKDVVSTIDVKYRENSDVIATLQPVSSSFINSTIKINPHNSMYTIADILPPPLFTKEFTTIKDATVRSGIAYQTLNYGTESSMMTGYKNGEEFESYIYFDIQLPQKILIKDAILKLYFAGNYTNGLKIKLYSVDRDWSEYGLTYKNKPQTLDLVSDTYTVDYFDRSIVFNLKNEINEIYTKQKTSKGYVIIVEHDNVDNYISFYTKESPTPPKLIIDYYDTQVYSAGRGQINSTLFVYGIGREEIGATITVHSDRGNHDLASTLYVHRYDTPVSKDLSMAITVTKNNINGKLIVTRRDNKDALATLRVTEKQAKDVISMLDVTRNEIYSTIYVKHQKTIGATITVQKNENKDVISAIAVNRDSVNLTIFVKERNYVNSIITVQKHEGSNITSTITVTKNSIPATIFVKERSNLTSTITVAKNDKKDLIGSITVTRNNVYSTINVKERKYMDATILVYQKDKLELPSTLSINRDNINAILTVKAPNDINSTMIISKPEIATRIFVRVQDDEYLNAIMQVRAKDASDLISSLTVVRKQNGAYYFIL